jgi:hypothetical protein
LKEDPDRVGFKKSVVDSFGGDGQKSARLADPKSGAHEKSSFHELPGRKNENQGGPFELKSFFV